jgi:hypothetical protein
MSSFVVIDVYPVHPKSRPNHFVSYVTYVAIDVCVGESGKKSGDASRYQGDVSYRAAHHYCENDGSWHVYHDHVYRDQLSQSLIFFSSF